MRQIGRWPADKRPGPMLRRLLEARQDTSRANSAMSPATVRRAHATVISDLNSAVRRKKIGRNPAEHIELETPRKRRPLVWTAERVDRWLETSCKPAKVMVWTPEQTGAMLDFALEDDYYALWHLMSHRPLRRSEAAGLAWTDVDLQAGTILIRETNHGAQPDGDEEWDETKSEAGERTATLDAETVNVLKQHRKIQNEQKLALGARWVNSGRVFTKPTGEPIDSDNISQPFDRMIARYAKIRKRHEEDDWTFKRISTVHKIAVEAVEAALRAPLPPIRLHDLRHGAASLMLAAGVDIKIVQAECGHATAAFTRDLYQHVFPVVARAAAEATAALIPRDRNFG